MGHPAGTPWPYCKGRLPLANKSNEHPGPWLLLRLWSRIGLQSFGGGAPTLFLIRREFVDKRDWIGDEEFGRYWNLCIMTPGINLIALTILIGRKLGGTRGIVVSLAGLLLPSATITCLLTVGFKTVQNLPAVQAILRGVVPATAGIMLLVGLKFAEPLLKLGRKEGFIKLTASIIIIIASALVVILLKLTVVLVLLCAALLGIALFTVRQTPIETQESLEEEP